MRSTPLLTALTALVLAYPAAAQDGPAARSLPEGWQARVDRSQPLDDVRFTTENDAYRVATGPAVVLYNPEWRESGVYTASARFTQNRAPQHPESYGIVIGGDDLDAADQEYSYFLVRGTGEYFIATRDGDRRTRVVDWTPHSAIARQGEATGRQVNVLGVDVRDDVVVFTVNGTEVARRSREEIETDGIVGFRVNHNLDVTIDQVTR